MAESDEEQFALEDESMDEVHDVDGESVESVDGDASPTNHQSATGNHRRQNRGDDEDGSGSESDQSELFNGDSSSSDSSSDESEGTHQRRIPSPDNPDRDRRRRDGRGGDNDEDGDDDDDDEPPEIPGSPLRTDTPETRRTSAASGGGRMNRLSDVDTSNCGEVARSHKQQQQQTNGADIFTISHNSDNEDDGDDDYETKETEAPRAMEFHSSSSSSDSDHSDGDNDAVSEDEESNQEETRAHIPQHHQHQHHARQDRPKTAARDLEPYRELVPSAYFEQLVQDAPSSHKTEPSHTIKTQHTRSQTSNSTNTVESQKVSTSKYKVRVPHEIEELFQFVDAFTPDTVDIPIRLKPFIPEYVPAIGVPFDGIQIPRPDGKADPAGVAFVRESCAQSNAAELELLLSSAAKKKQRRRQTESVDRVHSIEDALHRPREIDQWITSVAKVQASKPMPQVLYKKPMPSLTSLMELWPEVFEVYLSTQRPDPGALALSQLDVSLSELLRIVCGVVDIPVYDGLEIHSLHLLFALYHEVVMYEKEMQQHNR